MSSEKRYKGNNKSAEPNSADQIEYISGLIKRASQPMIITSSDRRLLCWNAAFTKLTGYSNKELGDPIISAGLTAPEWHESEIKALEKLQQTGNSQTFQKEYIRKDGSRVPVEILIYQLTGDNGKVQYYVGLIVDITERKELEEALQKSERHYRILVENAIEGVVVIQNGEIKFVNPVVTVATGYSAEEILAMSLDELLCPDNEKTAVESISKAVAPGTLLVVPMLKIRTKDGGIRLIESTVVSIIWDDEPANLNLLRDITERHQDQETLRESEQKYRSILEDISEGYWEVDLAGNFTAFNDAICRLVGYSEKEMAGMNYRIYTSATDVDKVYKAFNQVYRTGEPIRNMHYEIVRKDGSRRFAETSVFSRQNDDGEIVGFRGVSHDITDRRKLEESLEKERAEFKLIIDSSPIIVFYKDSDGKFIRVNKTFTESLQMSEAELLGKTVFDLYSNEIAQTMTDDDQEVLKSERPKLNIIEEYESASGIRWVQTDKVPIFDQNGTVVGLVGFAQDITERKQIEESLIRSEEKYRTILDEMEEAYYEDDLAGNFTFGNDALCRQLGYSKEELIGMNYRTYTPPEDIESVFQIFNQVYRTGKSNRLFTTKQIRKDGQLIIAENSATPIRNGQGDIVGFRGVARDITERLRIEAALQQSEEKYRTVLQGMEESYYEVDEAGNFTFFNDAISKQLGYSREELMGMNYRVYTPPEKVKEVFQTYNQVFRTGEPSKMFDMEQIRKDGTRIIIQNSIFPLRHEKGEIIGFRGVGRDVTERKQMVDKLRQSEERYRTILEETKEAYYEMDLGGNFTFFNDALCNHLGYSREELMGMNYKVYVPPEKVEDAFGIYNKVYSSGKTAQMIDVVQIKKDKTRIFVETSASPVKNEGNEIIGFRGVMRDVTKRRESEEAIKRSEERYRTIMDEMHDDYFETDLAGNYTFVNDALCRSLGASTEKLIGSNYRDRTVSTDVEEINNTFNKIFRTGEPTKNLTFGFVREDGSVGIAEMTAFPMRNEKGEIIGFRGVSHDITEKKRMEEALRQSEEKYRTILEDMQESYFEVDLRGNYTLFNDAQCRQLGYTREEMAGLSYKAITPPDIQKEILEKYNRIYRTGEPSKMFQAEQIRKDGKRIPVEYSVFPLRDNSGEIVGFRGVGRDITERVQMIDNLRRSEERYRTVMEDIEEGYYETDLEGNYTFFNDVICNKLGYSREELTGMNFRAHTKPEDVKTIIDAYAEIYLTGKPLKWFSPPQIRKDGTEVFAEDSVSALHNKSGEIIGYRGVSRDITERRRAEEEKRQLEQKAQLASRLASVGELASGVAHEINNPLTGVIGYAHLLLSRTDISRDVRHDLEVINEGAQRVAGIVKKLLAFSRQRKPEHRYVNVNELIRNTLDLRAYELSANNIKVVLQLTRDIPLTIADPGQLQQVFLNLIINAETEMKSAHDRGKLTIKTERTNNTLRITFKDTGPGIPEENLQTIFDPFFTTREVGQGTGLGLSVCHGIITEHNGKIWAESESGKGATFVIELPLTSEELQVESSEVVEEEPARVAKAKILVVDDEPVIRQFISQVLSEQGHTVETADSADAALKMVKAKRYRLILLDIKMPGMSGVELYKRFQEIAPSLTKRVVFITGDVMGKRTISFLNKTKTPYMMKPFDARELKTGINRILAKK
jgi:PAS domain S-box-containing protein